MLGRFYIVNQLSEPVYNNDLEKVRLLLDRGAAIDQQNKLGLSALILAASFGHLEMVRLLLDRGAPINHQTEWGRTALIFAASRGHLDMVRLLLDRGAAINHQTEWGDIAIAYAAIFDAVDKEPRGSTALIFAASRGHLDTVRLLLDRGAASTIMMIVAITR